MRRLFLYILLAVVAVGAGVFTSRALDSPYWALYQIGRAVHHRDSQRFLAYVNVDQVLASQGQQLPELLGGDKGANNKLGKQLSLLLQGILPSISQQVKAQLARAVADPDRENLASSFDLLWAGNVNRNGDYALVVLSHPQEKLRLRLGMRRPKGHHWQVVQINSQDLAALMRRYLDDKAKKAAGK